MCVCLRVGKQEAQEEGGEAKGGNAATAAAAVAASAPLRVTLEGAHWRTLAETTRAPVHLNL